MFFVCKNSRLNLNLSLLLQSNARWLIHPGCDCNHTGIEIRRREDAVQRLFNHPGHPHLFVCGRICMVVGWVRLAHPERGLPLGDAIRGPKHHGVREPALHIRHRAIVPHHAVSPPVWDFPLLLRVGGDHDGVRLLLPAGDQGRPNRGDDAHVEVTLVLEESRASRR